MRRPAPTLPVSPQQLKHFAIATVVITGLLALFAGGEEAGLAAQIEATQAKNDLLEAEQKKLGTRKLKAHLKLKDQSKSQFAFSDGGEVSDMQADWGGGGGGGQVSARQMPRMGSRNGPPQASNPFAPPPGLDRPGQTVQRRRMAMPPGMKGPEDLDNEQEAGKGGPPTPEQIEGLRAASRQRSGGSGSSGD